MNRSHPSYWLGFCVLLAAGIILLAVFISRSNAQDEVITGVNSVQEINAPSAVLFSYQGTLEDENGNVITDPAVEMSFKIFPVAVDGTACWTEDHIDGNAVEVQNGYFSVLLGQLVALTNECLAGDSFLELTVNGETLSPRELLTSVAHAVEAQNLSANATTGGNLTMNGDLDMNAHLITNVVAGIYADPSAEQLYLANDYGTTRIRSTHNIQMFIDSDNDSTVQNFTVYKNSRALNGAYDAIMSLSESGNLHIDGNLNTDGNINVSTQGSISNKVDSGNAGPHLVYDTDDCHVFQNNAGMRLRLCGDSNGIVYDGNTWHWFNNNIVPTQNRVMELGTPDRRWKTAFLESASCGAIVETNLQTAEEQMAEQIERFTQGDVLCWGDDQLELCSEANDRLVMSVADANGKPIVLGAEPIKVLGPVERGDILVASDQPGYAMVNNDPLPGSVIAQALEDRDGESGLVKAMIRKW